MTLAEENFSVAIFHSIRNPFTKLRFANYISNLVPYCILKPPPYTKYRVFKHKSWNDAGATGGFRLLSKGNWL